MAAIDYNAIEEAIASIVATSGVIAAVEEDIFNGQMDAPIYIVVYLESRVPTADQPLAAGTRTRYSMTFSIWVRAINLNSFKDAAADRDRALGAAELALMGNSSLNGTVGSSWLEGGEFISARNSNGLFMAAAEIRLRAEATAIT